MANEIKNFDMARDKARLKLWRGETVTQIDKGPDLINNEALTAINAAGTGVVELIKADTSDQLRLGAAGVTTRIDGMVKLFNRPTTDAFGVQVKTEFTDTDSAHAAMEVTADWKAAATTGGGIRGVQGVARLATTFTMTAGSVVGVYGQVANVGTMNGSGIMAAALYGLMEAGGGVYTAVSHIASLWLDSHLTETITAGVASLAYLTNNGTTVLDQAFYVYGGNKINALFSFDTCGTMIVGTPGTYSSADGYIAITVDGNAMRIPYFAAVD